MCICLPGLLFPCAFAGVFTFCLPIQSGSLLRRSGKVMLVRFEQDGQLYALKVLLKESLLRRSQVRLLGPRGSSAGDREPAWYRREVPANDCCRNLEFSHCFPWAGFFRLSAASGIFALVVASFAAAVGRCYGVAC